MNKKRCKALLGLVQLLPAVAAAAAVLFALPRTVPVLAAVPERLAAVVEQPVEAAFSEAEEEVLPKLPYADGVYVGSSRGYGGTVRVQVTMENGSITEIGILDASHETKQFLRRAKRLLATVVEAQSWEVDAVSEATYTSRGILGAVQNALTGEVVNNPLPPQPKPAAPLVAEKFTAPSTYLDGIYTAEAMGFEGKITVQITVTEDRQQAAQSCHRLKALRLLHAMLQAGQLLVVSVPVRQLHMIHSAHAPFQKSPVRQFFSPERQEWGKSR